GKRNGFSTCEVHLMLSRGNNIETSSVSPVSVERTTADVLSVRTLDRAYPVTSMKRKFLAAWLLHKHSVGMKLRLFLLLPLFVASSVFGDDFIPATSPKTA